VYLHGDGFVQGHSYTASPDYLMFEEIVLVTLNYRVGALGKLHNYLLKSFKPIELYFVQGF